MYPKTFKLHGNIVDLLQNRIFPGTVEVADGRIASVREEAVPCRHYIMPGLVDSHVHIESSMLPPAEFARLATVHGTVAAVADPHEIANVLGMYGIDYMLISAMESPFCFHFGVPSCVPATPFETAGGTITARHLEELLTDGRCGFMSEMMNFPGVLNQDPQVMAKLDVAKRLGKVVDGHAPGLTGEAAARYIDAGISTDHECRNRGEALEKIRLGMKILIREGSAARDFTALAPLIADHAEMLMFCSDDKHPDDLVRGHINDLVARAVAMGIDPLKALRCACLTPVQHYGLDLGLLQPGDRADCIVVESLASMRVLQTYIGGRCCAEAERPLLARMAPLPVNRFAAEKVAENDLRVAVQEGDLRVMEAVDGQLVTNSLRLAPTVADGAVTADPGRDILKLVVVNRYQPAPPAVAFIKGFGLQRGAIASSVAHDSHNIVAVGADDHALCRAINAVIDAKGGICAAGPDGIELLPLPIAGLMATSDGFATARAYTAVDAKAKGLGTPLAAPFMTLSFMALLVIPELKLSDKGLFDGITFAFTEPFVDA
ncbi:MAG: adenine deaminase [Desulfobulbaceae bacterium]|nr:adenine deaminase [Desulfobulbaceae bacterium]